ncbi:hypothetical protein GCM10022198_04260 [Klugiella xanthotipulae]
MLRVVLCDGIEAWIGAHPQCTFGRAWRCRDLFEAEKGYEHPEYSPSFQIVDIVNGVTIEE